MANIIIDKNKINKEPMNNRIANDGGVGSTDLLGKDKSNNFDYKDCQISRCVHVSLTNFLLYAISFFLFGIPLPMGLRC